LLPSETSPGTRVLRFAASRGRHRALSCRRQCAVCGACCALRFHRLGKQPPDWFGRTKGGRCRGRAQVLLPGGDLIISDIHHELVTRGSAITARGPAGEARIVPACRHQLGDYLRAAVSLGRHVRRCEEPRAGRADGPPPEPATETGELRDWPFSLMDYLPSATRAAGGRPHLVIWHFQLPAGLTDFPAGPTPP
jgi:hypothetical protein